MAKKRSGSSARAQRAAKSGKPIPDSQIDFSDLPESTDEELKRARRVGRPKTGRPRRQLIALRIDPVVLKKLRDLADKKEKPYQTFIHELPERAAKTAACFSSDRGFMRGRLKYLNGRILRTLYAHFAPADSCDSSAGYFRSAIVFL